MTKNRQRWLRLVWQTLLDLGAGTLLGAGLGLAAVLEAVYHLGAL